MNREEGHIDRLQAVILIFAVLSAKLFFHYPRYLIEAGGPAAWQVGLVMTATSLLLFLPISALALRYPGRSLAEICDDVVGPIFGTLLTIIVSAWFFSVATITVRDFVETYIIAMLPNTPPSVLTFVIVLTIGFSSYRGLEPLSRATQILFPLVAMAMIGVLVFNLPRAEGSRLFPIWGKGIVSTLTNGVWYCTQSAEAVILVVLGYGIRDPKTVRESGLISILLFGLTATASVTVLTMVFGAPDAAEQPFPMFTLARLIYLGRFVQRTEAVITLFWFFASAVRLSAVFHAGVVSLAGALNLPYYRPLIFPMAVLIGSASLLPKDFVSVLRIDRDWIRPAGWIMFAVPILLLFIAVLRGKGEKSNAA